MALSMLKSVNGTRLSLSKSSTSPPSINVRLPWVGRRRPARKRLSNRHTSGRAGSPLFLDEPPAGEVDPVLLAQQVVDLAQLAVAGLERLGRPDEPELGRLRLLQIDGVRATLLLRCRVRELLHPGVELFALRRQRPDLGDEGLRRGLVGYAVHQGRRPVVPADVVGDHLLAAVTEDPGRFARRRSWPALPAD